MTVHDQILIGFEVGSGKPVYLSIHHLAIFGMTQLSGKTTTLEALISRSGLKAIAFKTKRGEGGFTAFHEVVPYYKPRSDWQYVEGLLNTALREKVQFQPFMRWAILQVTKNKPKDLKEVLANAIRCEKDYPRRKEVFEQLAAYLRIVVPELDRHTFSSTLELQEGVNVMNISDMLTETQQLVIASTIEYAFNYLDHIIVIVPEAWESLPQGRMTPIKWVAQQFIRKGAAIGNYLWLDSQDIGGIDKTPLRQCDNWLMGRMKEAHEVERILKQLLGLKVPAEEIQTLPLGHFYAAIGNEVKKVYVLPADVNEDFGVQVALGKMKPEQVRELLVDRQGHGDDDLAYKEQFEESERRRKDLEKKLEKATFDRDGTLELQGNKLENAEKELEKLQRENQNLVEENERLRKDAEFGTKLKDAFAEILPKDLPNQNPANTTLNLNYSELKVNISHSERVLEFDTEKQQGQILYCAINDLPKEGFSETEMSKCLSEHGWNIPHTSLAPQLSSNLIKSGLLIRLEGQPPRYRLPSKVKIKVAKS